MSTIDSSVILENLGAVVTNKSQPLATWEAFRAPVPNLVSDTRRLTPAAAIIEVAMQAMWPASSWLEQSTTAKGPPPTSAE